MAKITKILSKILRIKIYSSNFRFPIITVLSVIIVILPISKNLIFLSIVTSGPLEWSNCRIHLRGLCPFVDQCLFHAGVTLERVGWVPPLDARGVEEEHRLFVQVALTQPQFFFVGEGRRERNEHAWGVNEFRRASLTYLSTY
jgi:hypothetical protein